MAILVDPPRWPAHGTTWAHLVSDSSLAELHAFARENALPRRSFDLDHYDVPAHRIDDLVSAGARPVPGRELVTRLRASGIRVRGADRVVEKARRRRTELVQRWAELAPATPRSWGSLGEELLVRWAEPHRRYHDLRHLHDVLRHLDDLADGGEDVSRAVRLAAWFHDAVYDGVPGRDEERSAGLAEDRLPAAGCTPDETAEAARLVRLTASHDPSAADRPGAALCDADLAILAAPPGRYAAYVAAVRAEYAHVPEPDFRRGRANVLHDLLAHDHLFTSPTGRARWEERARANVAAELAALAGGRRDEEGDPA